MDHTQEPPGGKPLASLIDALQPLEVTGNADRTVQGIQQDSRRVRPGDVFVAVSGLQTDGAAYIGEALSRGAVAVISDRPLALPVPCLRVEGARLALSRAAAWFHDYPNRHLNLIGVTGTNGKTSTCFMIKAILDRIEGPTGLIGSVVNCIGDRHVGARYTTPDPVELFSLFARMVAAGVKRTVMEVSSHALAQDRVAGCRFDAVIFTNLSHDHLDFHGTLANYKEAKAKLFQTLVGENSRKIINRDDDFGRVLIERIVSGRKAVTYGLDPGADLFADNIAADFFGTGLTLCHGRFRRRIRLPLIGRFNVYNALAAAAYGLSLGADMDLIVEALEGFAGVPGRLQRIDCGQPFTVFVDYAHTPDGLNQVLTALRGVADGRLLTVFGCTGDRDTAKRPVMGEVAARWSDFICITSDDPHNEDPVMIIRQVERGVRRQGKRPGSDYLTEVDRTRAIEAALGMAEPGDVVLLAGKGHERVQIFKDREVEYSDESVVRNTLEALRVQRPAG
jgi:UDP-N-acetylmuramoyl-L-alanyl-D-glutamate--2,6-diaminopimelate ligase